MDIEKNFDNILYEKYLHGELPYNRLCLICNCTCYEMDKYLKIKNLKHRQYYLENYNTSGSVLKYKLKIVGIKYKDEGIDKNRFYVSEKVINDLRKTINKGYSSINTTINNKLYKSDRYSLDYNIIPSDKVSKGYMIVSENLNYNCNYYYCVNNKASVKIENLYYSDSLDLTISNTYNKNNIEWLTGYKDYDKYSNVFFINDEEYEAMFNKDSYQVSVFINNEKLVKQEILLDKDANIKKVTVMDTNGTAQITMNFDKIDLSSKFNDNYFDLKEIIDVKEETPNDNKTTENNTNTNTDKDKTTETKQTSTIEDVIYPMYLPVNTYLSNKEKVSKDNGERLILTFETGQTTLNNEIIEAMAKRYLI